MPKHAEHCKFSEYYSEFLIQAAPDVLWYDIQDVGSYSGQVYGVGEFKKQILIYEDYYGSCSGCGGWGEGGEPKDQKEVLANSKLFKNKEEAKEYILKIDGYEKPNLERMNKAINEIKL